MEKKKKGRYDLDRDEFYEQVEKLARAGLTDREIANSLNITPDYFSHLKNGHVAGVSSEDNAWRSDRVKGALNRGRTQITAALHATYLNAALGKVFTRQKVKKLQEVPCQCGGQDPNCPECGGTGRVVTEIGIVQESEIQQPPSLQAITVLLNVYDPDWRGGVIDTEGDAERGIDIAKWIEQETRERETRKERGDDTDA